MTPISGQLVSVMLLPSAAVIAAGLLGALTTLPRLWRSAVQHFAAGVVFAAIATEIVPDVLHAGTPRAAILGFAVGVAAMFAMRWLSERLEARDRNRSTLPLGFLAAVSIDCLVDGVVIGTGFSVGARQGLLVSAALALEMFFLGLAVASTLRSAGASIVRVLLACAGLAAILGVSSTLGFAVLADAPRSLLTILLSFGSAVLLYLVTEELLVRAHEGGETRMTTSLFFFGFLAVFTTELLST